MALYAFDGTWNSEHNAGEYGKDTNVVRFRDTYDGKNHFYKGVGTRYGLLGKFFGGAFGAGGKDRIRQARCDLFENFSAGDEVIDVVGFSRGAALALHFTNVIARKGIEHPDTKEHLQIPAEIRFLGIWDAVAAFGIPINFGVPFHRINLGYRLKLPAKVRYCFHALALDELRRSFRPTRTPQGYELWFRGVHSDVGGGNENHGLNSISFRWMLRKAIAVGLPIDPAVADGLAVDPGAEIKPANMDVIKNKLRKLIASDRMHYTVSARSDEKQSNPPAGCPVESQKDERKRLTLA